MNKTDALIQAAVRNSFKGTILMIAHRLLTIRDATLVMVMSAGALIQVGPPAKLLAEPPDERRANFSAMVVDAGLSPEEFQASPHTTNRV